MALPDHINDREKQKFVDIAPGETAIRVVIVGSSSGGGGGYVPTNTIGTALSLDGSTSVTSSGEQREILYVKSSGGAVTNTVNPQVVAGTIHGQELLIIGTSNTNKIKFVSGNGLLVNGDCMLKSGSSLLLFWNQSVWSEISRNDI